MSDVEFDPQTGEIRILNKDLQKRIQARIDSRHTVWVNLPDEGLVLPPYSGHLNHKCSVGINGSNCNALGQTTPQCIPQTPRICGPHPAK